MKRKGHRTTPPVDTGVTTGKRLRWIRSKTYKVTDEASLHKILHPDPPPQPEFKPNEYIRGVVGDSKLLYQCHEANCGALFTTETSLLLHGNKHLNPNLKCTFCGALSKTEEDFSQHYHDYHPDLQKFPDADPLKCKKCNKVTRDIRALWRHIRDTCRPQSCLCPYCELPLSNSDNLNNHIKYKHFKEEGREQPKFACKVCAKEFLYRNSLQFHIRNEHRGKVQKRFECKICNSSYACKSSYNCHMRQKHSNPTFYPCHICNKNFMVNHKLNRHNKSKTHLSNIKRAKKNGGIPFITNVTVIKTVKTVNPNLTNEQLKEICRKTVVKIIVHRVDQYVVQPPPIKSTGSSDNEAENDSSTTTTYLNCIYCDKPLQNLDAVKTHEAICFMKIRNKRVNVCPICDKEFSRPFLLKHHARVHMEDRPFNCDYCDTVFKSRNAKLLHEKTLHFGIRAPKIPNTKVYKCEYPGCGKEYETIKSYRSHKDTIHLGIRYKCEECGKLFRRKTDYHRHIKKDHNHECAVRLECKPCNRSYVNKQTYLTHLLKPRHLRKIKEFEKQLKKENVNN